MKIQDPEIRCLFDKLYGITTLDQINCSTEFVETQAVNNGRATYPQAVFFNRQHFQNFYFDSPAYGRSKLGNCFVSFWKNNNEHFGQIQFFMKLPGSLFNDEVHAMIKVFKIVENIGPVRGFFFRVEETTVEILVPLRSLKKVFHCNDTSDGNETPKSSSFKIKLCQKFDHS